jgi:hypothetical protein
MVAGPVPSRSSKAVLVRVFALVPYRRVAAAGLEVVKVTTKPDPLRFVTVTDVAGTVSLRIWRVNCLEA